MFVAANAPSAETSLHERARRFPRSQLEGVGPARISAPVLLVSSWSIIGRSLALLRQRSRGDDRNRQTETGKEEKNRETGLAWVCAPTLTI